MAETRACIGCGVFQHLDNFPIHRTIRGYIERRRRCLTCWTAHHRAHNHAWKTSDKGRAQSLRDYRAHRVAHLARVRLNDAVQAGRVRRGPCEVCGTTERVHGHHDDYAKPLEVRWLCEPHHKDHHRLAVG